MKKLLLITYFNFQAFFCLAQDYKTKEYIYVIPGEQNRKTIVAVDYGQKVEKSKDYLLTDNSGKAVEFESVAGAINYFSDQGFDFVDIHRQGNPQANYYLFRKRVPK